MRFVALASVLVACSSPETIEVKPAAVPATPPRTPAEQKRRDAIGDLSTLSPELQRAFDPTGFALPREPEPGDWLYEHPETPQTFARYVRSLPNLPDDKRHTIYLLPIGEFPGDALSITALGEIVGAYFTLEVKVLPAVPLGDVKATSRRSGRRRQLLAPEVLTWLRGRVPDDAYALMALTMTDLYPEESWNFVFGMASFDERVGVQSFARQDPAFFGEARSNGWRRLALRRATWTVVHEIAHMFGLTHCTHFACVIAGSNSQAESDRAPLHACPVCLRKLHYAIEFDPARREDELAKVLRAHAIDDEAAWSERRAAWIRNGKR